MTEAIVNYLNLKLETVGRLGVIHCLAELRSDGTTTVPYVYSGTGQVVPINIDGGNLSYWRMDNPISFEPIVGKYGVNQMSGTYDLRLVVVARRKDSTVDDAFMPTRLAEDIANLITGNSPDLKLLLKAQLVSIRVNSIDTNIPKIWGEEFTGTQVNDLNYTRAIMALSVSVTVIGSRDCWQNECDIDPNILHIFDFCNPNVFAELTPTQVACLEDALCDPCLDATVENSDITFTQDIVSGVTYVLDDYEFEFQDASGTVIATEIRPAMIPETFNFATGLNFQYNLNINGVFSQVVNVTAGDDINININ